MSRLGRRNRLRPRTTTRDWSMSPARVLDLGVATKWNVILAMLLIAAGIGVVAYLGLTFPSRERVLDLGSVQGAADQLRSIPTSSPDLEGSTAC